MPSKVSQVLRVQVVADRTSAHLHRLQDCLAKNGYNEAKCAKFVDALYECCQAFYERNGSDAVTASCPKANLLQLKMEQRRKGTR